MEQGAAIWVILPAGCFREWEVGDLSAHACTMRILPRAADVQHQHERLRTGYSDHWWFILDLLLVSFPDHLFMPAGEKYETVATKTCFHDVFGDQDPNSILKVEIRGEKK